MLTREMLAMTYVTRRSMALFLFLSCAGISAQAPPELFKAVTGFGPIDEKTLSGGIEVSRYRIVQAKTSLFDQSDSSSSEKSKPQPFGDSKAVQVKPTLKVITLNLFEDVSVIVDLKDISTSADQKTTTWDGIVRGYPQSSVTLTLSRRIVFGNVTTGNGKLYEIRPIGQSDSATQAILEVNTKDFPKESSPIPVVGPGIAEDINPNAPAAMLNVLVVYTQASAATLGSFQAVEAFRSTAERETNQGYENSGVLQRIKVVAMLPVQYSETDGYGPALERLANPHDGYMDEVHQFRAQYHADMVVLLIKNSQSCGLSYLAQPPTPAFASSAFSVVNIACATGYFSFGHELGHLQGCNHDRADADGPGAFPFSYGFQQTTKSPFFRDIMSYDCATSCPRINYWSNPQIQFQGIPVGDISAQGSTNNALTLNRTQTIASGWHP